MLRHQEKPWSTFSNRLRAARLAAGFGDIKLATRVLCLRVERYEYCEHGWEPNPEDLGRISRVFGVSSRFLAQGQSSTARESFVSYLARKLTLWESQEVTSADMVRALVTVRLSAGFGSPAEAAAAKGWDPQVIASLEDGTSPLSMDDYVIYCLRLGYYPTGPFDLAAPHPLGQTVSWWREQTAASHAPSNALARGFEWLQRTNSASQVLDLPVVSFVGEKWQVESRLILDRNLLPADALSSGDALYAAACRGGLRTEIVIVDPTRVPKAGVLLDGRGNIHLDSEPAGKVVDPAAYRPRRKDDLFLVGQYVTGISIGA